MRRSKTYLALATLPFLSPPTLAGPSPTGDGCSPGATAAPSFSLLHQPGDAQLFLQADPELAGGLAVLFVEDPFGPFLPPGPCVAGMQGRLFQVRKINGRGRVEWELPLEVAGVMGSLRALAWPDDGDWAQTHVSNVVKLGPHVPGGPSELERIVIREFQKDPTVVSDTKGEWIELWNAGSTAVNLEGWTLADLGTDNVTLDNGGAGMWIPAGGRLVLGREADPALNGGIPVDHTYASYSLSNGEDEIVLIRPDGLVVDQVVYDDGVLWPDEPGKAISLDPAVLDATGNDDGAAWCAASSLIGAGPDTGTPGALNDDC
ncbi:MAG: lamin tail domain-containing protein [Planctomycetota bacterium]|nr:lamin tail domain-containing protein [Planctomycetota bacterium]